MPLQMWAPASARGESFRGAVHRERLRCPLRELLRERR